MVKDVTHPKLLFDRDGFFRATSVVLGNAGQDYRWALQVSRRQVPAQACLQTVCLLQQNQPRDA